MPKKSKRRAKTGGGSGGNKAPGGGGGGTGHDGADDKKKQTAKNSDENSAGILTTGAVRMFSECAKEKVYSVPKNTAPVLQIVSDLEEGAHFFSGTLTTPLKCYLSDGERCISASLSSDYGRYAHLLQSNQIVRHSIIRVPSYYTVDGVTISGGAQDALVVGRMEVVERDVGCVLGRTLPASCPAEGILTAGAIRMLLEEENMKKVSFVRERAPILQVVGDFMTCIDRYTTFNLSDGRDWIKAVVPSNVDMMLMSTDLMIKHSIIRMENCMVAPGTAVQLPSVDRVLVLGGLEVVARNVGRLIGNPTKAKKSGKPTHSSSPSSGRIGGAWSYAKKLQVAREHSNETTRHFGDGSGDVGAALHHLSSYFQLSRDQTEPFRAAMLMRWRVILTWPSFMMKRDGKITAEMVAVYDRFFTNDRAIELLKRLSSVEGGESVLVRAMASFIRGHTLFGFGYETSGSLSNALSCLRRFSVLVSECDLAELASTYGKISGGGEKMVDHLIDECTGYLRAIGGPSQRQVSSIFDQSSNSMPFLCTIGGNFCCGKTPEGANLPILFKCKTCRLAWYCSPSCQAECWGNGHRGCCKKFGRFEKGDRVILWGLKKRPELNGTLVSVEDLPLNGRAVVRVLWSMACRVQVGAVLSIKKENMKHHRPLK